MSEQLRSSAFETRNSLLREKTSIVIEAITTRLHDVLPDLSPTQLNVLSVIGVSLGSFLATQRNGKHPYRDSVLSTASLAALSISASFDAIDGTLARIIAAESPAEVDFRKGQIYDVLSDRSQEAAMALARSVSAHKRGDKLGTIMALLTAATSTLPSIARAYAESQGRVVPEAGKGLVGIIGTRVGRATFGIAATVFPEVRNVPIQLTADTLVTGANIITAIDRFRESQETTLATLPQITRDDGRKRLQALTLFAGISFGAAVFTYLQLHKKH